MKREQFKHNLEKSKRLGKAQRDEQKEFLDKLFKGFNNYYLEQAKKL